MKFFSCTHCAARVFFENVSCGSCASALGYVADEQAMVAFSVEPDGSWQRRGSDGPGLKPCLNYSREHICNWMVRADGPAPQCSACSTTHTIPALAKPENHAHWAALEGAKRRLFYTLIDLELPVPSKAEDPLNGLSFEFLEEIDPKQRVLTGHDEGVITLNVSEADPAHRERIRLSMREPYRTLLGHFRHESGHYYWDRLVRDTPWIDEYRALFGDERADYAQALKKHYDAPATDWPQRYISVYASSHPWEDWAECWAHYLHMVDGLDTAATWGLTLDHAVPSGAPLLAYPVNPELEAIERTVVEQWLPVSQFVNAMNRSLGTQDTYPFVVPQPVIDKLEFIHRVVVAARRGDVAMNFGSPAAGTSAAGDAEPTVGKPATDDGAQTPPIPEPSPPATPAPLPVMTETASSAPTAATAA